MQKTDLNHFRHAGFLPGGSHTVWSGNGLRTITCWTLHLIFTAKMVVLVLGSVEAQLAWGLFTQTVHRLT
jgi:hypothetical protein